MPMTERTRPPHRNNQKVMFIDFKAYVHEP